MNNFHFPRGIFLVFGMLLLLPTAQSRAELIPADRLVPWTPGVFVGVPNGIRQRTKLIDVSLPPFNADRTGSIDASAAIQAAVNAAKPEDVVYVPSGTYLFNGGVTIKNYVTVRGDGIGRTTINYKLPFGSAFFIGSEADYAWNYPPAKDNKINFGFNKGSAALVMATAPNPLWVGKLCQIRELNDSALPVVSVVGYQRIRKQMVRIVSVDGNIVSIFPPLYWSMDSSRAPDFAVATQGGEFSGIEDMTIDSLASPSPFGAVRMAQAYGCWIKNIQVLNSKNYALMITDSLQCEMRGCWAEKGQDQASNHAALLFASSSGCLVEDNILNDLLPAIEINFGASGNVFGYNLIASSQWGGALNANHGPHNHYNLFEGNVAFSFQSDGYFGSASEDTLFRNWLHGIYTGGGADGQSSGFTLLKLNRLSRNASVIGNIIGNPLSTITYGGQLSLGKPNIGNEAWVGEGPPWSQVTKEDASLRISLSGSTITASAPFFTPAHLGWFILDRTVGGQLVVTGITSPTVAQTSSSGNWTDHSFAISPGPAGWQELDLGVIKSTLFKSNYYFPTSNPKVPLYVHPLGNPINPDTSIGSDALPLSLYLSERPAWFGGLVWPPFDPQNPGSASFTNIPAGARFFKQAKPSPQTRPTSPKNIKISK